MMPNIMPYQTDDIYLHKLINYKDLFELIFNNIKLDSICEIGIEIGEFTSIIEIYLQKGIIKEYHGVDVCITPTTNKISSNAYYHQVTSLEYLTSDMHTGHDFYLIDGDHNYYTVSAELENIFAADSGKKICILHDTNWPCARRDFYYNPGQIPEKAKKPLSWDKKLIRNSIKMQEFGFYGKGNIAIAEEENTPRNGVMTSIEDFISGKKNFKTISFPQFLGLTILYNEKLLSSVEKAFFLDISMLLNNKFIANCLYQLEYNRLDIYTRLVAAYQLHEYKNQEISKLGHEIITLRRKLQQAELLLLKHKNSFNDNSRQEEQMGPISSNRLIRRYLISELENVYRVKQKRNIGINLWMTNLVNYVKFHHASLGKNFDKNRRISHLSDFVAKTLNYKLVTLDFFDTLVIRSVEPPELVKDKVAEMSCDILCGWLKRNINTAYYHELRAFYENKLSDEMQSMLLKDHETTLQSIITNLVGHLGFSDEILISRLMEVEIQLEMDVLKANNGALKLLRALKQKNKRIIVVSDMYLPRHALIRIAKNLGMEEYIDEFYVSGDIGYGKYSSRLFTYVAETEGVAITDIIHLGDNFNSDYFVPNRVGISSYWLHQTAHLKRRYLANKNRVSNFQSAIDKLIEQAIPVSCAKPHLVAAYYKVFAPVVFSMAYKNLKDSIKLGIKNFYFLAREGLALKVAYDLLLANHLEFQGLNINTRVLYVSRASSICARYQGKEQLGVIIDTIYERFGALSYDNLLNAWLIREGEFDYQPLKRPEINQPQDIYILFKNEAFSSSFDRYQRKAQENLYKYLQQEGVFEQASFFVDIGWRGTIQSNIQLLISEFDILGAYLGTSTTYGLNSMKGYLFNEYDLRTNIIIKSAPILEKLLSVSSVKSTLYYQRTEKGFIPVFQPGSAEVSELEIIRDDCFKQFAPIFEQLTRDYCLYADEMINFAKNKLYCFVTRPNKYFIREVAELEFELDWGDSQKYKLIKPIQKRMLLRKPKMFYRDVISSLWIFATLKVSGLGILNFPLSQAMCLDPFIITKLSSIFKKLYYRLHAKINSGKKMIINKKL